MAVVVDFNFRIKTDKHFKSKSVSIFVCRCNLYEIARPYIFIDLYIECFLASQAKNLCIFSCFELKRKDTHKNKVGTVDTLIALSNDRLDAEKICTFGSPVTGRAHSIVFACKNGKAGSIFLVFHASIIDTCHFASRPVCREAAFSARGNLVADADVRECSAHHHFMVTAA
ncbi:Uncharacterised protein [Mycobacteroides abscessus subsp. abscessus]|nr:Uncharacterised protein [Mycobacteroides abscessus subsp. abscessus]